MQSSPRAWFLGFAGGFFLSYAIQALAEVLAGGASVAVWIQLIAGTVVVVSSVAALFQMRKSGASKGSGSDTGAGGGSGSAS